MGKGVAFRKKRGDPVNQEQIQKVFALKDPNILTDLTTLLANVPLDFVTVSYELIDQVKTKYSYDLESYVYITLTTHLFAAYSRLLKGKKFSNYLPDLSQDYPVVYQMANELLTGFAERLKILFPAQESKSVAFHFLNAHLDNSSPSIQRSNLQPDLIKIIENGLEQAGLYRNQTTQIDYDRLLVHLKYLLVRLKQDQFYSENFSAKMLADLQQEYSAAWRITQILKEQIKQQLDFDLPNDEQAYLTIHLERLLKEKKNGQDY